MFELFLWGVVFLFSLTTLIIAADFFIKASENMGVYLGIPPFIVGVTLVAIGTSLPELITSILAVTEQVPTLVLGNVVGSNIANLCLVLGIMGIMAKKIELNFNVMKVDLPMLIGSTFLLAVCVWDGTFSLFEGVLFLVALIIYLSYVFTLNKSEEIQATATPGSSENFSWKQPITLLLSAIIIYFSAKWNVESIKNLADLLMIGTEYIAQTAVALGTSLPELVVSVVALKNNNAEIAVGNVMGSNIFNIFAVMGIPRMFGMLTVPESMLVTSVPIMVAVTILAFFVIQDKMINRWEGWILLLFYVLFIGNLFLN
ncbi:MAG: calcium/sodium antiporter [Bacteroidota bacterium]